MWGRLWLAWISLLCTTMELKASTKVAQDGATFGWEWRLSTLGDPDGILLPQAQQQVSYAADDTGYHGALSANTNGDYYSHSQNFALGQKAIGLTTPSPDLTPNAQTYNYTQLPHSTPTSLPTDFYLVQQEYSPYIPQNQIPKSTDNYQGLTQLYDIQPQNNQAKYANHVNYVTKSGDSVPLQNKEVQYRPIAQVYKDHNCTDEKMSKELQSDLNKSKQLFAEVPTYAWHDLHDDDLHNLRNGPLTYKGAVNFRVETPSPNARHERFYYTTIETPTTVEIDKGTKEGIKKLVASTQDLISNEDLLQINHAEEKHIDDQSDDIIKPRSRWIFNHQNTDSQDSRTNHITVTAKIENIVNGEHSENQQVFQSNSNDYRFATPIFVPDPSYQDVKEQIVNNLVSTMVPYIANGYQIVAVRNSAQETKSRYNSSENRSHSEEIVNVTPRPVSQNYLAPITVALRLLNDNDTYSYNSLDDHEASDSELVPNTIKIPVKEKTTVEVQESISGDITHINAVEVHDSYLEEGRSNDKGPFDYANSLYNKYLDALASSEKIREGMNKILYEYGSSNEEYKYQEEDHLEPSENVRTEVEIKKNQDDENTQSSESISYYNVYRDENQKIVQPIIIEKEVPITKFVDRYIETKVPYPQEIHVPVDRPVPVAVPYERVVEKPVEVTRYVDKPYPVEVPRPYPVEVKVPYPVEQNVYIDRPIHIPYPVEKVVEKPVIHPVAVPTPIGIPYEVKVPVEHQVFYPVPIDRPVAVPVQVEKAVEKIVHKEIPIPYPVEKKVPYPVHYETRVPVPYPVEKRIPVPVEKIVEKPVTVTKVVERPVRIEVPVPQRIPYAVHVPQPYPVNRIVEKKVPYPVQVDRIVEKQVQVPYPVEKIVEKIVEKPVMITKYVDKPYPVEKRVPYAVEKIVEKRVPYAVKVPVEVKVPYPVDRIVEKQIHVPVPFYREEPYEHAQESKNNQNYQIVKEKRQDLIKQYLAQYYQLLKEKQQKSQQIPVQKTHWGNQYAVSHQYINHTTGKLQQDEKKNKMLAYLNEAQKHGNYYGPAPTQNQEDWWQKNKKSIEEVVRRTDREPRVANLRIEYGGFKPPLIPSTEVDLDGTPVKEG